MSTASVSDESVGDGESLAATGSTLWGATDGGHAHRALPTHRRRRLHRLLGGGVCGATPVAVHPATPCDHCPGCTGDRRNVCADTRYLGSAARLPHVHGGFAQRITVPAAQVRALPPGLGLERAVLAEPLSVVLHAVRRVGDVTGRRVLVTGAGPIGWVAAPRRVGSAEVVVSDLPDAPLALASQVGATSVVRVDDPAGLGEADIVIEASGSPAGLRTCLEWMRRAGRVVLLGLLPPGQVGFLGNA